MTDFYTQYRRPEKELEKGGGNLVTEADGYIPAEVQIMEMLSAGYRLGEYRKEKYDFPDSESVDEDFIDPTRSPGFGPEDASVLQRMAESGIQAALGVAKADEIARRKSAKPDEPVKAE